jgi:hypothetical protein
MERDKGNPEKIANLCKQVLRLFRVVFWDILPCKIIVD